MESAGFLKFLVFPENEDHGKQAHAGSDQDEDENERPAGILQSGPPSKSPRIGRAYCYPGHQHEDDRVNVPNCDEMGDGRSAMREEKEERDGGNGQGNDLADVGIEVPYATQK